MKTTDSRAIYFGIMMLFFTLFIPQRAFPQSTDSLFRASSGSLQFQLLGGLGLYYIGDWGPASYFRIGVDASFRHSSNSGDGDGYSNYYSTPPSAPSSYSSTSQPEQNSTSYDISVSGVYARQIAGYANAILYCGIGPTALYSRAKYSSSSSSTRTDATGTYVNTNANDGTNRTWGIGPLAILGVRNRILDHVSLSAEVSLSALYQWSAWSGSSRWTSTSAPSSTSSGNNGENSSLKGWSVSLSNIRIGVIVDL